MKLPKHKYLLTYRYAEIIHDLTVIFVKKYISYKSRTRDQMEQAARSAKQNIVEGISEGETSKKGEIKFLGFAKSSTDELLTDYEDFLRQRGLKIYPKTHPQITSFRQTAYRLSHLNNLSPLGDLIEKPSLPGNPTNDANFLLTLCHQLSFLLSRQIKAAEAKFIQEGGYSENLFLKRLKQLKGLKQPKSFTLLELLIIISLISLVVIAAFVFLNPFTPIKKSWDGKRKNDLATLRKVIEDFYNDKQCYPKPTEICYNSPTPLSDNTYICNLCGRHHQSPSFSPYLLILPCDPQYPAKDYLYQIDNTTCPGWYKIYSVLSNSSVASPDNESIAIGCQYGCGPKDNYIYQYAVTSPNVGPEPNPYLCSQMGALWCRNASGQCNVCGEYDRNNQTCHPPNEPSPCVGDIYYEASCTLPCVKD